MAESMTEDFSTREAENAMWVALKAAASPPAGNEWAIQYDREGPR